MTEQIMQCCYTNAEQEVGGTKSSGWQPVAFTDNIPSDAYNTCVNLMNANSTIQTKMEDERGDLLNLFEINSDGSYVYVSRTQYGLLDRLGRPNMFAHAYIFSWKRDDVLCDPNVFLTLTRENFTADVESAKAPKDQLARTAPFTLETALAAAGMGAKEYLTLIQCVYSQYSERKPAKPVYVQYDGTELQMQAILYCIYYGIPHHMRRNLSVSSAVANTSESKNLIFSVFASKHDAYVIPQTGENNILTPRTERKISRYGFVDHAARHYASMDVSEYFIRLEKLAVALGDPAASNELILKIAHQMIMGTDPEQMSNEELDGCISDALRSKSYGSVKMEEYISAMLDLIRSRKMFLTEESEANLMDRLASPVTSQLAQAGEQYNFYRFRAMSVEEAAQMLSGMSGKVFDSYCQNLSKSQKGIQILDHYYSHHYLSGQTITWELLNGLADETAFMSDKPKTTDVIDSKAWVLYDELLACPGCAVSARNALLELMCKLYGADNCARFDQAARESYWEKQTFENYRFAALEEYKAMSNDSDKCNVFAFLHGALDALQNYGGDSFLKAFNRCVAENRAYITENGLLKTIVAKTREEAIAIDPEAADLSGWIRVAALTGNEKIFEELHELGKLLKVKNYGVFVESYRAVTARLNKAPNGPSLVKVFGGVLIADCRKQDAEEWPVPLDVWMVLGESQYPNCFQLLSELTPCILQVTESIVVSQSKLLGVEPYAGYAEDYLQEKTPEAKIVRKWLGEQKAAEKRKRAEEKKAKAEAEGPARGRGFGFAAAWAEDDSKPAKAPAKPPVKPASEPAPAKKTPANQDASEKKGFFNLFGRK